MAAALLDHVCLKCGTLSITVACQYFIQYIQPKLTTWVNALLTGFKEKIRNEENSFNNVNYVFTTKSM
jgi:hypothetical protein